MTRQAFARTRLGAAGAAVVVFLIALTGCGLPATSAHPLRPASDGAIAEQSGGGPGALAAGSPGAMAPGTLVRNAVNGRTEVALAEMNRTVLLIGDSQSEPADGWTRQGLSAAGYTVYYCGRGGTGFVADNGATGNYIDALLRGDWLLPAGTPALIVIQGGGNDAASGADDDRIAANAVQLIEELETRYPDARIAMIGTLARGEGNGGGRRTEVDALLGSVATAQGLPFISTGDWLTKYGLAQDLVDAVHMNSNGRQALGAILHRRLRELGLELQPTAEQPLLAAGAAPNGD